MRPRRDRGAAAVELTLLTPALVLLVLLVVLAFRVVAAQAGADAAAHAAARAATLQRTPEAAQAAAEEAVAHAVRTHNLSCTHYELELSTGGLEPGSTVTAALTCHAELADLSGLRLAAGTYTATGQASALVDTYRSGEAP